MPAADSLDAFYARKAVEFADQVKKIFLVSNSHFIRQLDKADARMRRDQATCREDHSCKSPS